MLTFDDPSPRRPVSAPRALFLSIAAAGVAIALTGCVHNPPAVDGVRSTPRSPAVFWTPPRGSIALPSAPSHSTTPTVPADLAAKAQHLTLTDVVDVALRNNPATRVSWAQARTTAAAYGSERGNYFPTLTLNGNYSRSQTVNTSTRFGGERTQYGPSLSLSYLLLDFGGRSSAVDAARQAVFAANLNHNATVQDVVLQVAAAYFTYMGTRALLDAQRVTVQEATANVEAAVQRHEVGLATIADELQAKTALAQAQLAFETTQGNLQAARGGLAVAMGLPANPPYDVEP
jgi:outer membrane protein TolC